MKKKKEYWEKQFRELEKGKLMMQCRREREAPRIVVESTKRTVEFEDGLKAERKVVMIISARAEDERDRIKGVYFAVADNRTLIYDYLVRLSISIPSEDSDGPRWYWLSPSAAAKISVLSTLAIRVYALDSAVLYEKLSFQDASETYGKEDIEGTSYS
ncbi:hypothetical protein CQW23_25979 [Capsicum baccatum]|uniref:Uncharacterized protein n=1 Tax=Capsicum baccatum TaxID=33114 RepID=A0A2G2VMJ5_CAPBA|nr:hypothetical protein CQW23_25979 [Capsicum baccatum]